MRKQRKAVITRLAQFRVDQRHVPQGRQRTLSERPQLQHRLRLTGERFFRTVRTQLGDHDSALHRAAALYNSSNVLGYPGWPGPYAVAYANHGTESDERITWTGPTPRFGRHVWLYSSARRIPRMIPLTISSSPAISRYSLRQGINVSPGSTEGDSAHQLGTRQLWSVSRHQRPRPPDQWNQ